MAELDIDRITLKFGGLTVLNAVSMSVEAGQLFALIGPNGAGKTSVFNCISGLYGPQGSIRFRGEEIAGRKPQMVAQLGIARTFQHGELFPEMSVLDNLLAARHYKVRTGPVAEMLMLPSVRREEARHRAAAEAVLALVELERYRDTIVASLPFGIQKIVGFARALAAEPKLLLMDEPSAGLARGEREDLAYFILKIKAQLGLAMIWIEHDMQMVADLADRIHVLDYGRSLTEGPAVEVLTNPEVVRAYIGAP
jgi:branched-chain amino acid transport system ATP-binding protein